MCNDTYNDTDELVKRFAQLNVAQKLIYGIKEIKHDRILKCFRWQIPFTHGKVNATYSTNTGKARYSNLMVCNNAWLCPVCSYKVMKGRAEEIRKGAEWAINQGYSLVMLTFTHSHHKGQALADLVEKHSKALSQFHNSKGWKAFKDKYGYGWRITSNEVTYGDNGWHYHSHVLYIISDANKLKEYEIELKKLWVDILEKNELKANISNGLDFLYCENEDISSYISKWGIDKELAGGNGKKGKNGGKTPFELLEDKEDYNLFVEYAKYFGNHQKDRIRWANGLKKLAGVKEKTDKELAKLTKEEKEDAKIVITIGIDNWKLICKKGYRGKVLKLIERQKGGTDLLNEWLVSIGGTREYESLLALNIVA